jgi:hypothetical protein
MDNQQRFAPPTKGKPKQPAKKGSTLGGIIVIVVFIAIIVGIVMALSGGSKKPTAKTVSNTPAASTSAPTTAQQVASWETQYGSSLTNIVNDFTSVSKDASNPTALAVDCQKIASDVTTAQGQPPIPNSATQSDWSSALSSYASGAQDCTQGLENNDATMINKATTEFSQGNTSLDAASASIQSLE